METEVSQQMPATNKQPNRRGAAAKKKQPSSSISEIDDNDDGGDLEIISDDDFEPEDKKKKGGRKPANGKAAKPPLAATKKRAPAASKQSQLIGQKLITEVLKPAANSPEKKVRKMRSSPFNKKSGSILGRTISIDDEEEEGDASGNSASTLGSASDAAAVVDRPKRANRGKATYVVSDDSEGDDAVDLDDSASEEEDIDISDDED